ncbi:unnamed protein product [Lactuca virosa]|uniref:Uncharacterized protein n=1 Tax=Lactuca virosa TaxID=75947 RepID=A0AAU9PSQ2_9ASTR|nr:unnamed protein product [Lactuca virosa]
MRRTRKTHSTPPFFSHRLDSRLLTAGYRRTRQIRFRMFSVSRMSTSGKGAALELRPLVLAFGVKQKIRWTSVIGS